VDGTVNLTGFGTISAGESLKYWESGRVQFYLLSILIGLIMATCVLLSSANLA
jgi:NAD(P)H-quinone oxidoreductase subunit 5